MEHYNWIKAYYASQNDHCEQEIFVRQMFDGSEFFVDKDGCKFHVSELDLTRGGVEIIPMENPDILKWLQGSSCNEREYWRKLRCEVFTSVRKDYRSVSDALEQTEFIVKRLYQQDKEFFKNKENE